MTRQIISTQLEVSERRRLLLVRIEEHHVIEKKFFSQYPYDVVYTTVEITFPTHKTYGGFLDELRNGFSNSYQQDMTLFDFLAYGGYNRGTVLFRIILTVPVLELSMEDQHIYTDLLRVKDDFENRNSIKYSPTLDLFEGDPQEYAIVNLEDYDRFEDLHKKVRELIGFSYSGCTNMDAMEEEMEDINHYPRSVKILFIGIPKTEKNNLTVLSVIFLVQQSLKTCRRIEFIGFEQH
jgi:hypothetical protein